MTLRQIVRQVFLLDEWEELPEREKSAAAYRLLQFSILINLGALATAFVVYELAGRPLWVGLSGFAAFIATVYLSFHLVEEWYELKEIDASWSRISEVLRAITGATA